MTTPKQNKKKKSKTAKLKANAQKASKILETSARKKQIRLLKTKELAASPAKGLLGKHHKWRLTEVGSEVGLGVTDDLEFCNGIINCGRCVPFPINVTLVLE